MTIQMKIAWEFPTDQFFLFLKKFPNLKNQAGIMKFQRNFQKSTMNKSDV